MSRFNPYATASLRDRLRSLGEQYNNLEISVFRRQKDVINIAPDVERYLKDGADPDAYIGHLGTVALTPLQMMVALLLPDAAKLLIDHGADLTLRNGLGENLLMMPFWPESTKYDDDINAIVQMLLEAGADPNQLVDVANKGPVTAMAMAARQLKFGAIDLLIQHGARADTESAGVNGFYAGYPTSMLIEGFTYIGDGGRRVRRKANECLARMFAAMAPGSRRAAIRQSLKTAITHTQTTDGFALHLIRAHGAAINGDGIAYETPLALAAEMGNSDLVRSLIKLGADVNLRGLRGRTALQEAVDAEQMDVVNILVGHGASLAAPFVIGEQQEKMTLSEYCNEKIKAKPMKALIRALLAKNQLTMAAGSIAKDPARNSPAMERSQL